MSNNNIILIGYMGSGKTTLGKELAKKLGRTFIDLDGIIESAENTTISELFHSKGETYFRKIERIYLKQLLQKENSIIALGGGAPCYRDNMELINNSGIAVYLKVPAFILQQRLEKEIDNRPILLGMNPPEMLEFIQHHIGERESYYLQAKLIFNGSNVNDLFLMIKPTDNF